MKPITLILAALCVMVAVLLSGCEPAESQQGVDTVTWTNPTQWENGDPLTAAQLDDIIIQWGPQGGPYNQGSVTVAAGNPGAVQSTQIESLTLGTRCYIAFAVADGITSNASNEACKTVRGRPNPPTGLGIG